MQKQTKETLTERVYTETESMKEYGMMVEQGNVRCA